MQLQLYRLVITNVKVDTGGGSEDQMKDGPTTLIREGPGVWVDRNRVSLHNTRKI